MENKKKFNAYDKVLVRDSDGTWLPDFYSFFYCEEKDLHASISRSDFIDDSDILPYEGNEHLVGTNEEPEEKIELKEGEWVFVSNNISDEPRDWTLGQFKFISDRSCFFVIISCYKYAIRFSDFKPDNMEETKKHILRVRFDGKITRHKNNENC